MEVLASVSITMEQKSLFFWALKGMESGRLAVISKLLLRNWANYFLTIWYINSFMTELPSPIVKNLKLKKTTEADKLPCGLVFWPKCSVTNNKKNKAKVYELNQM